MLALLEKLIDKVGLEQPNLLENKNLYDKLPA